MQPGENCTRRHYFERYAHRCVRRGPLPRGAPRVRGHIGPHRRQVDSAGGRRALAWTDALQTDLQAGRGCLATHADADAEEPGARWPRHANGLPDQSATGVAYELTERGKTLIVPLHMLWTWAQANRTAIEGARRHFDQQRSKDGAVA